MSDDYLWDRSGVADSDEIAFEKLLSTRSLTARRNTRRNRMRFRVAGSLAFAAIAAALIVPNITTSRAPPATLAPETVANTARALPPAESVASAVPVPPTQDPVPAVVKRVQPATSMQSAPPTQSTRSAAEIQHVIASHTGHVRRECWAAALKSRAPDAPDRAKVVIDMTVAPSGSVSSVAAQRDPAGYPGLASCVVKLARTWVFPAASDSTKISVPFVFVSSQ